MSDGYSVPLPIGHRGKIDGPYLIPRDLDVPGTILGDITIGAGVIKAHLDGWALPGGHHTTNRAVAIRAAKGIHRLLARR